MQIFSITVAISLVISLALASPTRGPVDDGFGVGCNNRDLDSDGILNENECDPQLGSDSSTDFTSSNFTTEAPKVMNVTQQTTTLEPSTTTTVAPITTVASTTLTPRVSSTVSPTTANYTPSVPEQTTQTKSSNNATTVTPASSSSTIATVKPTIFPSTASNLLVTQPKQMNITVEKRNQILTTNQTVSSTSAPILAQQAKSSGSVLVLANVVVFAAISAALCVHASVI